MRAPDRTRRAWRPQAGHRSVRRGPADRCPIADGAIDAVPWN